MKTENALKQVSKFFRGMGMTVTRSKVPMPVGSREVLVVAGDIVVVHPKDKRSFYRIGQYWQHGIRESLLKHYAANDYIVCFYEEDTQSVVMGEAVRLLTVSRPGVMPGKFEGEEEVSRFIDLKDLVVMGVVQ